MRKCFIIFLLVSIVASCSSSSSGSSSTSSSSNAPKVALVLGGGGAKGAAEIGALRIIEKAGVDVDIVVGTSIGAVIGSLYAAGYSVDEMEEFFLSMTWNQILVGEKNSDIGAAFLSTIASLMSSSNSEDTEGGINDEGLSIEELLDSLLRCRGVRSFNDTKIPFKCVAAEEESSQMVVLSDGRLSKSVRASMAIPGMFSPVEIDGMQLVDGGMANNLPIDVARDMGADIVIAIDLQQGEGVSTGFSPKEELGVGGVVNWVFTRPDGDKYRSNREDADVYIHPELENFNMTSFGKNNCALMIELGEDAAKEKWDELKSISKLK